MRIYYCGYVEPNAIAQLAAVGSGKRTKNCGETAHWRCDCPKTHADDKKLGRPVTADHPKNLCHEHAEALGVD